MTPQYICQSSQRRRAVLANPAFNGFDFLEVLDQQAVPLGSPRQQTLLAHFFQVAPLLSAQNLQIEGGVRIAPVNIVWVFSATAVPGPPANPAEQAFFASLPNADHILVIRTDSSGDFSTYTLRAVQSPSNPAPPAGFDSRFESIDFSFKVECPSDFDCQTPDICPPADPVNTPQINYVAKDYASFRDLMLDRLSVTMPGWQEQSPADLGMALVEVMAYGADRLSYYQDAVATEAYLGTARKRVSVRRHARLLDYAMHDGCNARVWVHIAVTPGGAADGATLSGASATAPGTALFTQINAPRGAIATNQLQSALNQNPLIFETVHDVKLFAAHNAIRFYTWGDGQCCLLQGATEATLRNDGAAGPVQLSVGDALLFEEVLSPSAGDAADADPAHRWVVRLTAVTAGTDALTSTPVVEINWSAGDALPFPLCLSAAGVIGDASVARGNIVLADHGFTTTGERLPLTPGRYRPKLKNTDVTFSSPDDSSTSAALTLTQDPRSAIPAVRLIDDNGAAWTPLRDLLEAGPFDRNFVVETEVDGTATLRFGDGILGAPPVAGFQATYRTGNGAAGHVGSEAIAHALTSLAGIQNVRNPLPSQGGVDPEPSAQVQLYAPHAFRTQERAVTEADYAAVAGAFPQIEKAEATLRSTGAWHTMFVTVQRTGGQTVDPTFRAAVRNYLETFRLAGFDVEVEAPVFVPLDIALTVYVAPDHFQSDVEEALLETFSNRQLTGGKLGFFYPDNFTFGQTVYLSQLVAAAMQTPGVLWIDTSDAPPNRFQRFGQLPHGEFASGRINMGRLEIARLDNDPNEPENGQIQFFMQGGL